MPSNCCVFGCHNFGRKTKGTGVRYFSVPVVANERFGSIQLEFSTKRREAWIKNINREEKNGHLWDPSCHTRVCSAHFISGEPSLDPNNPDFAPSLHMGHESASVGETAKSGFVTKIVKETFTMGVLNFCDSCGALRVREVKDQLETLITVKTKPKPNHCGLCQTELDLKEAARVEKQFGDVEKAKDKTMQKSKTEDIQVKVEMKTRLQTGTIKPVHFEDLDSEDDNASIDVPFDSINDVHVEEESDAGSDVDDQKTAIKVEAEKVDNPSAENIKQMDGQVKKKMEVRQEKVITEAEFAKRQYLDEQILAMVEREVPKTKSLTCRECKMVFCQIQKFVKHISTHMDEELIIDLPYVCPICSHRAVNFKTLDKHLINSHKLEKTYICKWPDCKAKFACKRYLTKHIQRHKGLFRRPIQVPKLKCSKCEYMAFTQKKLIYHENTHTQAKPFKCEFCDRGFNNPRSRTIHTQMNHITSTDKRHVCETCGYSSVFRIDVLRHRRIHTGEKPFVCEICGYRSNRLGNLHKHLSIHTDEKKHKCHYCEMVFQSQKKWKAHEKDMHANELSTYKVKESDIVEAQASVSSQNLI